MFISSLRGDLPAACLTSLITDATWGYPGGVCYSSLLYVTARTVTKAPVTSLLLSGSSLHGGPQCARNTKTRMHRKLCCNGFAAYVPAWHFSDCDMALPTEQARGGVRQV